MLRLMIKDDMWSRLKPVLKACGIHQKRNLRMTCEAIFWKMRTGAPWRDLPTEFGPWSSVYNQFNRWSQRGVWEKVFFEMRGELDNEWNFMDATVVKAHQHSIGAKGSHPQLQLIGKTAGGNTTKIHMICDSHGMPVDFVVTAGQVHDVQKAGELIALSEAECIVADKGYDSDEVRSKIKKRMQSPLFQQK